MYKTPAEARTFFRAFKPLVSNPADCEILVCVQVGAQNLYWASEGTFTGEISGPMLKAAGCSHVIVGHS